MLVSEAIVGINYALRGTEDDAPLEGTEEYTYWLHLLNKKKNEFYRDVKRKWSSAFDIQSIGAITESTSLEFDLPLNLLSPSDSVYVITTNGSKVDLDLVSPEDRDYNSRQVYIKGINPQVLVFNNEVKANENIIGGTLYLPGWYLPADLVAETDKLPFRDPEWAVMAVASEVAFADIVYEDKAPELNSKANNLYRSMAHAENNGTHTKPSKIRTSVSRRISGY